MKIEQVIALHLFNNKYVSLQGIGTFRLDSSISTIADLEKDVIIPEGAVSFEYNPKATEDEALIDSIVKHTTKIKPLASADLDSFLMLGRQFLNIGKPFTLDRLGTLDKAQTGELVFLPGQFITPKIEAPKALKENENEESSGLFNDYNRKPEDNSKKILTVIAVIVVLALIGWAIYYFLFSKSPGDESVLMDQAGTVTDTVVPPRDSMASALSPDTTNHLTESANNSSFKIIFFETNDRKQALSSMNKLNSWGHHVIMYTEDSVNYKLAELFQRPLSDTGKVKDSMTQVYRIPVVLEVK